MRQLLLVIEVQSPSTARADRFIKRRLYQERRVELYWIVDPEGRAVEVWSPDAWFPNIEVERVSWAPSAAGDCFSVDLGSSSTNLTQRPEQYDGELGTRAALTHRHSQSPPAAEP